MLGLQVAWSATALGSAFDAYEVFRLSPDGLAQQIGEVTTEATTTFVDHEARRGIAEQYATRVRKTNGAFSLLSAWSTATLPIGESGDCAWLITSNVDTDLAVEFDATADQSFAYTDTTTEVPLHSTDGVAFFYELEDRLSSFDLRVMRRQSALAVYGDALYSAVRAAARRLADLGDPVPYLCVRDPHGNRWFAGLSVSSGQNRALDRVGEASVHVRELTRTPYVAVR